MAVNVEFEKVIETAGDIRSRNSKMTQTLEEMQTAIRGLGDAYISEDADVVLREINALKAVIDTYRDDIEGYAKFLEGTVAPMYRGVQKTLVGNAETLLKK